MTLAATTPADVGGITLLPAVRPPVLVPPLSFSQVAHGVYRSGYPNAKNFPFLLKLGLRSIVYLDPEDYAPANRAFLEENGIELHQFAIKGNKEPFTEIAEADIARVLAVIENPANQPVLVHCLKGKHRVGCIVGCLRKQQRWSMTAIFGEYRRFAGEKIRIADQECIEMFGE
ncbi:protein-tyrosine phosphatase [Blastocladiella britannica]|nr:protein-tyrosine phosphatase [Blastocladiella britannica]